MYCTVQITQKTKYLDNRISSALDLSEVRKFFRPNSFVALWNVSQFYKEINI